MDFTSGLLSVVRELVGEDAQLQEMFARCPCRHITSRGRDAIFLQAVCRFGPYGCSRLLCLASERTGVYAQQEHGFAARCFAQVLPAGAAGRRRDGVRAVAPRPPDAGLLPLGEGAPQAYLHHTAPGHDFGALQALDHTAPGHAGGRLTEGFG